MMLVLDDTLAAVADRIATAVPALADRVAVGRVPQGGSGWLVSDGPYVVVDQTGPVVPVFGGDGETAVETVRVSAAVWRADDGTSSTVAADVAAALDGWPLPGEGIAGRVFGVYRVPQPETDVLRTEVEVRYAHRRPGV